jgi:hypothetical protein
VCGKVAAIIAGLGKEAKDEIEHAFGKHPKGWEWQDVIANKKGIACAETVGIPLLPKLAELCGIGVPCCDCCTNVIATDVNCPKQK